VLQIAAGFGDKVEDHFESRIREYAARIDWDGVNVRGHTDVM
jgi:hypothetical protein